MASAVNSSRKGGTGQSFAYWVKSPRSVTRPAALCAMAAGSVFTIGYIHWFRFAHPERDLSAAWWLGISPEGIGAVGALLGAAVLLTVSLLWPATPRSAEQA